MHVAGRRAAGIAAVGCSGLGVAADLLLQFTPDQAHLLKIDAILTVVPLWRLFLGTYLGLVVFVLAGAGIWHASAGLVGSPRLARVFLVTGVLAYVWGAAFHATFLFRGVLDHADEFGASVSNVSALQDAFQSGEIGVLAPSALMLVVASVCYAWAVARGGTAYPRWAAALCPLPVYVVLTLVGIAVPWLGLVVTPATFSLTSLIFFTGATIVLWRPMRASATPALRRAPLS